MAKKKWQEPIIRSIDQCAPIFGACATGTTQTPNDPGPLQCSKGNGAGGGVECITGNGANNGYCCSGNGAITRC